MKSTPRTAHCTYAHSLKYSSMSPMHLMKTSRRHNKQHATMFPSFWAALRAVVTTTCIVRTRATVKEPKQMLPKEVVSATPKDLRTGASVRWLYHRANTPQYVT